MDFKLPATSPLLFSASGPDPDPDPDFFLAVDFFLDGLALVLRLVFALVVLALVLGVLGVSAFVLDREVLDRVLVLRRTGVVLMMGWL